MIIENAVRTALANDVALAALVGARIYYSVAPQDTLTPYVAMSLVSSIPDHNFQGASNLTLARFQFSIFAATYLLTKQIADAIKTVLQGYSGTLGGAGGVAVNGCFYEDEVDLDPEQQTNLYGLAVDYRLWHQ